MQDLIWLIQKTLVSAFRKKSNLIITFILPVVGILISLMVYSSGSEQVLRVGVTNLDGNNPVAEDTVTFLNGLEQIKVNRLDEASVKSKIASGELDAGIVLNQGFSGSIMAGKPEGIQILSVKGASATAYVKALLQNYIGNAASIGVAAKGDEAAFNRVYDEYRKQPFKVEAEAMQDTSKAKNLTYQSLGFLVAFMMFSSVNLTEFILKERENRTFLRLMTSPVSAKKYVLSNVLVNIVMLCLQTILTLCLMKYAFHIDSGLPFGELLFILMLFGLAAVALSLLIVAVAKNSSMAGALQNLIITPTCLLAGCYFPNDIMPDNVRKVANFLPQHWLLDTVDKLQKGTPLGSLYMNLLIILGFAAAFAMVAIYRFNRNNDTRTFI